MLKSSKINYASNILNYLLIAKRLEHLGDNINGMVKYNYDKKKVITPLEFVMQGISRCVNYISSNKENVFRKTDKRKIKAVQKKIGSIRNHKVEEYVSDSLRCLVHIEEELVNISFHQQLLIKQHG